MRTDQVPSFRTLCQPQPSLRPHFDLRCAQRHRCWIAGILVAIFTATLYWTAKQEFLTTHRPALVVHNVAFELAKEPGTERQRENGCIMAYVVNEGGTPATVFEYTGWLYRERKAPWTVVGGRSSLRHREDFQRGANRPGWRAWQINFEVDELASKIEPKSTLADIPLYFIGYVLYRDSRGVRRRTGFLRKYDPVSRRFLRTDDADYDFHA